MIAQNKKARLNFHILDTIEAGVELHGSEVKSVRAGKLNLSDSFARIDKSEAFLYGCHISPYEHANSLRKLEAKRPRRLLLHKKEIMRLAGLTARKGCALVALDAHWRSGKVKIELGIAKGKHKADKRQDLKKRVENLEARREMVNFNKRSAS